MENKIEQIFNIKGKKIIITGSTGYFGKYISRGFLEVGARVILLSRSNYIWVQEDALKNEFGNDSVTVYQVDFYQIEELKKIFKEIVNNHDIDVLINNAYDLSERTGFNTANGTFENSTINQWSDSFTSGIYWPVLATQYIGEQFLKKGRGNIINISSMYGVVSPTPKLYEGQQFLNPPTYCVVKSGLIAFTKYIASFWGPHGIRCNAIAPGPFPNIETESANSVKDNDEFIERLKERTVLNCIGHPTDLLGILIYLACDASRFTTGQTICVDGGWTVT